MKPVSLQELMAQSDAVSVQVIYASRYQGFINDKLLAHCKPGQLWVGISRSHLFDAQALAKALTDGRIEACMLDGAESGFASKGTALHELDNLFLTPRLGSHTRESRLRASWYVAHRLHETLAAPRPPHALDPLASAPMDPDGAGSGTPNPPQFIIRISFRAARERCPAGI